MPSLPDLLPNGVEQPDAITENSVTKMAGHVMKVTVKCRRTSGCVLITASRVPDSCETEIQLCKGDPRVETNWLPGAHYQGCKWRELTGLTPGKVYHFRARWVQGAEHGPWSPLVMLRVR